MRLVKFRKFAYGFLVCKASTCTDTSPGATLSQIASECFMDVEDLRTLLKGEIIIDYDSPIVKEQLKKISEAIQIDPIEFDSLIGAEINF